MKTGTVTLDIEVHMNKDLQPTLGLVLPVYTDVACLTILYEAVLHLYFFVSWLHMLHLAASQYVHADYNVDDLYPLYVHIRYPAKVVITCTACMRAHDEHVDDVSRHR